MVASGPRCAAERRPPRGGRGLKQLHPREGGGDHGSPPTRGAWIETFSIARLPRCSPSPPTRGAWIETQVTFTDLNNNVVAPHAGGVD